MQVSVSTVAGLERRLEVAVPAERVAGEIETRLKQLARTARLKGFRPGKAPFAVVKQQFSSQVQTEVIGDLLRESYSEAVSREKLRPATDPRIEGVSAEPGAELRFTAVLEVLPDFTVKPVADLAVERPSAEVSEADIESMRRQRPDFIAVERAAADGDRVTVDFEGRIDGETFQGGTGSDIKFVLGKGQMLAEFEDGARGATAGESRSVTVNFPADYGSPVVAGKTAVFAVTVTAVDEEKLPTVDDAFCEAFGVTEGGIEALRRDVRESMQRELAGAIRGRLRTQVLDALFDANPIEVPKSMVAEAVQGMQLDFARRMGIRDPKQLPAVEALESPARRRVALGLLVGELLREQDMKVDRERVQARLAELVGDHPQSDEMRRQYLQNADTMRQIESAALEEQLIEWVVSKAKVTDKPASFADLTGFGKTQQ
jgi:trigger factor